MQTHFMERLSFAYVRAVAARAEADAVEPEVDLDSTDLQISKRIIRPGYFQDPKISLQVKSTSDNGVIKPDHVAYQLNKKNYDDLRSHSLTPRYLVVVVFHADDTRLLHQSEEELILRRCAYWRSLADLPDSSNTASVTVKLPRDQIFDVPTLSTLLMEAATP